VARCVNGLNADHFHGKTLRNERLTTIRGELSDNLRSRSLRSLTSNGCITHKSPLLLQWPQYKTNIEALDGLRNGAARQNGRSFGRFNSAATLSGAGRYSCGRHFVCLRRHHLTIDASLRYCRCFLYVSTLILRYVVNRNMRVVDIRAAPVRTLTDELQCIVRTLRSSYRRFQRSFSMAHSISTIHHYNDKR